MLKRLIICSLTILVSTGLLLAHGDATHIMGVVSSVQGGHVMVKTQGGKSEIVMLGKATKYLMGDKAATVKDLKVGTRVVIDAKMDEKMKMFSAEEVRIGVTAPAAKESKDNKKGATPESHPDHK